jgi:F0F1-type ATP synthase assembly protein I
MPNPKKKSHPSRPSSQAAAGIATKMFSTILAGVFVGMLVDYALKTDKPYFTAFFSVVAVFYALYSTLRDFL